MNLDSMTRTKLFSGVHPAAKWSGREAKSPLRATFVVETLDKIAALPRDALTFMGGGGGGDGGHGSRGGCAGRRGFSACKHAEAKKRRRAKSDLFPFISRPLKTVWEKTSRSRRRSSSDEINLLTGVCSALLSSAQLCSALLDSAQLCSALLPQRAKAEPSSGD